MPSCEAQVATPMSLNILKALSDLTRNRCSNFLTRAINKVRSQTIGLDMWQCDISFVSLYIQKCFAVDKTWIQRTELNTMNIWDKHIYTIYNYVYFYA